MADLYALSESDLQVLREVIDSTRKTRKNPYLRGKPDPETSQSPEVYLAKTPDGGIPGPTGVSPAFKPGFALCTMARMIGDTLFDLAKSRNVYSVTAVPQGVYVQVHRDKLGTWWAIPVPGVAPCRVTGTSLTDGAYFAAEVVQWDDTSHSYVSFDPVQTVWLHIEGPDVIGPPPWHPLAGDVYDNCTQDGVRASDKVPVWTVSNPLNTSFKCPQVAGLKVDDLPTNTAPDFVIGYKNGCLVKVQTGSC